MSPTERDRDAALVDLCLRGDADAFRLLADRYYRPVSAFVLRKTQRPDAVEDLAQETFLEAYRSLKAGKRPEVFSSWLFGIAHNCCGKWLRRKKPVLFDPGAPPAEPLAASVEDLRAEAEESEKLMAALARSLDDLPDETRHLLRLKHRDGKTCEQIAAEVGRPVGTIKSLLARTYQALRQRLGGREGEGR